MPRHFNFSIDQLNFQSVHKLFLFGSKLGFSQMLDSLYGAFWQCSRIWL